MSASRTFNNFATRNVGKKKPLPRGPVYKHLATTPSVLGAAAYSSAKIGGGSFKTSLAIGAGVYGARTIQAAVSQSYMAKRHRANARSMAAGHGVAPRSGSKPLSAAQVNQRRQAAKAPRSRSYSSMRSGKRV